MSVVPLILFLIFLLTLVTATIEAAVTYEITQKLVVTPKLLYYYTKMNWFGCYLCTIIIRILNPVVSILYFFYWITHVKR